MINSCLVFIIFWLMTATLFVGGCFVHPTSVVATVGERVLLTCTTHEGGSITSWHVGENTAEENTIYQAPIYTRQGTIRTPEKVAEGYFAIRPVDSETALYMNRTVLSQAGLYVCTCDLRVTAVATVVVLDSEPKFTTNHTGAVGAPVTFSCSVSFNASSDVSCELRIEDISGFMVARSNESTVNNGLIACKLEHTITANASSVQRYTCNVTLSTKGNIIYSRELKATVEWRNGGYQVLAFSITLTVACVIITIVSAATIVFYRKYRKLQSASDAKKISTEETPANYAALDVQKSCEVGQRDTYTAIQLPIYLELH